jgi:hypothetical protein
VTRAGLCGLVCVWTGKGEAVERVVNEIVRDPFGLEHWDRRHFEKGRLVNLTGGAAVVVLDL